MPCGTGRKSRNRECKLYPFGENEGNVTKEVTFELGLQE